MADWKEEFESEINRALAMRAQGNEGQARVCARRAAGSAIREYLTRLGQPIPSSSAYDLLNLIASNETLDPALRQAAVYLSMRVTEEFKLPVAVDLVEEARRLADLLLPPETGA